MKVKRSIFLLITILPSLFLGLAANSANISTIQNFTTIAENHAPISIEGNAALAAFVKAERFSGDGSPTSPYIIENLVIDARNAHGITINNTDAHLIIQNCTVGGSNSNTGIYLYNTANVNIINNYLSNNFIGINLEDSCNNNTISGNTANNNDWCGINLDYLCTNNTISRNTANNNNGYGIYLSRSSTNTLSGNTANYNMNGILLSSSGTNTLSGNNASYNSYNGIRMSSSCNNNTLSGNTVNYNARGIKLTDSSTNTLSGNTASYNNGDGIRLTFSCNNNMLSRNTANYNTNNGIYLGLSSQNTLSGNTANHNSYNGIGLCSYSLTNIIYFNDIYGNINSQAVEENCYDNQWDNGTTGNYWGADYLNNYPSAMNDGKIWNIPYEISGNGTGLDHFPLVNSITFYLDYYRPQFTDIPENLSAYEGYTDLSISWVTTDLYPATYTIELNGTEVVSPTTWTSGTSISYNVPKGLLIGDHNITIIVTDERGNTAKDTVIFTVTSTKTTTTPGLSFLAVIPAGIGLYIRRRKRKMKR